MSRWICGPTGVSKQPHPGGAAGRARAQPPPGCGSRPYGMQQYRATAAVPDSPPLKWVGGAPAPLTRTAATAPRVSSAAGLSLRHKAKHLASRGTEHIGHASQHSYQCCQHGSRHGGPAHPPIPRLAESQSHYTHVPPACFQTVLLDRTLGCLRVRRDHLLDAAHSASQLERDGGVDCHTEWARPHTTINYTAMRAQTTDMHAHLSASTCVIAAAEARLLPTLRCVRKAWISRRSATTVTGGTPGCQ